MKRTVKEKCKISRKTLEAAKRGDADALLAVGAAAYTCGDYEKAMSCYEKSAAKGNVQALVNLGYCHYYGRVGEVDYESAFKCFSKAVAIDEDVSPEAFYKLGDMYLWGNGVEKDVDTAYSLFRRAYGRAASWRDNCLTDISEVDDVDDPTLLIADAARRLGDCFRYGTGVEKDPFRAFKYYAESELYYARKVMLGDPFAPKLHAKVRNSLDAVRDELHRMLT